MVVVVVVLDLLDLECHGVVLVIGILVVVLLLDLGKVMVRPAPVEPALHIADQVLLVGDQVLVLRAIMPDLLMVVMVALERLQ
jgi:hypothetical protein